MNGIRRKFVAATVAVGASTAVCAGAGAAQASPPAPPIAPGHYVMQTMSYGVIPTPESNATVVGNRLTFDYLGLGPQGFPWIITPIPGGAAIRYGADPVTQWMTHWEVHKTPTGYYGTQYEDGQIPIANIILTKTNRIANQPR